MKKNLKNLAEACVKKGKFTILNKDCDNHNLHSSSKIGDKNIFAHYFTERDPESKCFHIIVRYAKKIEHRQRIVTMLINTKNSEMWPFHYSLCHECGTLELRSSLFMSGENPPKEKYYKIVEWIIDDVNFWFSRIWKLATNKRSSEDLIIEIANEYHNFLDKKPFHLP
jgi:hypothetical protein